MPKKAISVTLDENNLLWLRGRAPVAGFRSVSDTLDRIVTEARMAGRLAGEGARSVVGSIDIAAFDPLLDGADAALREEFQESLQRPLAEKHPPASASSGPRTRSRGRR